MTQRKSAVAFAQEQSLNSYLGHYPKPSLFPSSLVIELEAENQKLRDENNRLKGEQDKPDIKANQKKQLNKNYSSEKERKTSKNHLPIFL